MVIQLLNGVQLAMLLMLLSVGLSVIFGLMNFINLAHGTLYMVGAYLGLTMFGWTGSFLLAALAAAVGTGVIGVVLYQLVFRRLSGASPVRQVLLTFGLIYVGLDGVRMIWGNYSHSVPVPALLAGRVSVLGEPYPIYRLFIIGLGLATVLLLYLLLERTRIGAMVRAGVNHREAAMCLGINTDRLFLSVFGLGCMLAGLAGLIAAPVLSIYPGMDAQVLTLTLIIVVIGGPGSLPGAALGSVLIGLVETFGRVFVPQFAAFFIYALAALVLLARPRGLVPIR